MSPYELAVGLRYTRARRGSGRNTFISFIALTSMAGIALGVAALIVVLSVMNGFQEELRNRILSVASHIEIRGLPTLADDAAIARTAMAIRAIAASSASVGRPRISMCDATDRIRLRSSSWKPFITDSTTISAATPNAMPAIDVSAMNEMNVLRPEPRRARV